MSGEMWFVWLKTINFENFLIFHFYEVCENFIFDGDDDRD